ncbi:hypothetical protein T265_06999 [Opisthorchis viverrini]|uniref:dihydropyrimidinase n=1 Tax=Opisthorchis viverrini TaxID=6198 RepID=A0A075ACN2_OPIVI|nr:hypothetical protein T265_06999 [Opisthorchis viverrini]KER25539.1 hypothetical protein T265_06999 [Opisthorchis viverrini]
MPEPAGGRSVILLKGGIVVNHDLSLKADILIQDGIIKDLGPNINAPDGANIIDVNDQYVLPGGVDLDCHLTVACPEDPVADTYLTASQAALLGGTTTIVNTVYTESDASVLEAIEQFQASCAGKFACDYAACPRLPRFDAEISQQLEKLVVSKGVCMVQLSMGYSSDLENPTSNALTEQSVYRAFRRCRQLGILPMVPATAPAYLVDALTNDLLSSHPTIGPELHYHNHPESAEGDTILNACLNAFHSEQACPLLVTRIQSAAALNAFLEQRSKCRGLIFGQTSIGAIAAPLAVAAASDMPLQPEECFTKSKDWAIAAAYVCDPPLRPDIKFSQRLLAQMAATDELTLGSAHCAIRTDVRAAFGLENSAQIPKGVAALGCRLPVLWYCGVENNGGMDPCSFVRVVSTDPARLINAYPRKGRIAVGSDADIIVWSRHTEMEDDAVQQLVPAGVHNIFSGLKLHSRPDLVFLRGCLVVKDKNLIMEQEAQGKYLHLKPFSQMAFSRLNALESCWVVGFPKIPREPYAGKVVDGKPKTDDGTEPKESHYFRKEHYDNVPKVALPPGQRQVHTSVKTAQPPGGASHSFW